MIRYLQMLLPPAYCDDTLQFVQKQKISIQLLKNVLGVFNLILNVLTDTYHLQFERKMYLPARKSVSVDNLISLQTSLIFP